jgi:hypothetical protein
MCELDLRRRTIEIRAIVVEASQALARLDANRLEELAIACRVLNQKMPNEDPGSSSGGVDFAAQSSQIAEDLRGFRKVLDASRANLSVLRRQRHVRDGKFEYSEAQARGWVPPEQVHGDN